MKSFSSALKLARASLLASKTSCVMLTTRRRLCQKTPDGVCQPEYAVGNAGEGRGDEEGPEPKHASHQRGQDQEDIGRMPHIPVGKKTERREAFHKGINQSAESSGNIKEPIAPDKKFGGQLARPEGGERRSSHATAGDRRIRLAYENPLGLEATLAI
jgi:hypothetical protein